MRRGSGILLHISSLPALYGIGDFGQTAYRFVDFLEKSAQSYWQLLPLNPTDPIYGNSPYSSPSAFAVNELFIDPEYLVKEGWLEQQSLKSAPKFAKDKVDYVAVASFKNEILRQAFQRFRVKISSHKDYQQFCMTNAFWLEDYSQFVVLKQHFSGQEWARWPQEIRERQEDALQRICQQFSEQIEEIKFRQYVAFKQILALREYCRVKNIDLVGDIPIYVNFDSADVWAHPNIFKLDPSSQPIFVAGVPPDYFSQTGQRWGNPVYNWDELKREDYDWWIKRVQHNLQFFDQIRIDHFRGFIGYWQVPVQEQTAVNGEWQPGPGDDFFYSLKEFFGEEIPIIAEDLGLITQDVTEAMQRHGFPGMKVLLFAFGGDLKTHPYIPENYSSNCVVYTGTHDNNTVKGWFEHEASKEEKKNLRRYLGKKMKKDNLPWIFIQLAMKSPADVAIIPMQDLLGLGAKARMNVPGTPHHNWEWRMLEKDLGLDLAKKINDLTKASQRLPCPAAKPIAYST